MQAPQQRWARTSLWSLAQSGSRHLAAETEDLINNAQKKRKRKAADWIIANDVSSDEHGAGVMGGEYNRVHIISGEGVESLDEMPKQEVAMVLAERIASALQKEAAE